MGALFSLPTHRVCRIHTSWLRGGGKLDSLGAMMADGEVDVRGQGWTGAVWRGPPAKRGAWRHAALVARPGESIRRLAGTRAREEQITCFLGDGTATAAETPWHAVRQA